MKNKTTFLKLLIPFISALFLLISCTGEIGESKISSSGKTCEMIVVMNDVHWEAGPGEAVRQLFESPQPALPQEEPWMDIVHMVPKGFGDLFQKHRNIIIAEFDPSLEKAKTEALHNVWSQPQVVIRILAPNDEAFVEEFNKRREQLFRLVRNSEYARLKKAYLSAPATLSQNRVKEKFNINLNIPLGFNIVLEEPDFIWMKREASKYDQGIFIYKRPYTSINQLNDANIILLRDSLTRKYVPGPLPPEKKITYMAIELLFPPLRRETTIDGNYAVELRGEWKVEGDMMGGPFVNYTVIDTLRNNVIWLDGYVYNPGGDKRDALMHVEGVLQTLSIVDPGTPAP